MATGRYVKDVLDENPDYEGIILFDNPSYDTAFLGITDDNIAVYDFDRMVEWLVENENMTEDEAVDRICYNASYRQNKEPIIVRKPIELQE